MTYLITGACGFIGSNLSAEVLKRGDKLVAFDNLSRLGSEKNLAWLKTQGAFEWVPGDVRNQNDVEQVINKYKPDMIFHLAGQVAMTTSIANPRLDFEINVNGTFNVLEAVRKYSPTSAILYSSTNKVYGDLEHFEYIEKETRYTCKEFPEGFSEEISLDFRSPYGCSKGSADQYILDYTRIHGLKAAVFRHSSVFGSRQFASYDQGWIGWFVQKALETQKNPQTQFTISGTGKQVRDVLFSEDIINCYFQAAKKISNISGQAFNIGGGIKNSLSLIELFNFLEKELSVSLNIQKTDWRQSDQRVFVANTAKAEKYFGWKPEISSEAGLRKMIQWIKS